MYSRTGVSQSSTPWSTSIATAMAVNALVVDAMGNSVLSVAGRSSSRLRFP